MATREQPPPKELLAKLPRWGLVALAIRCARRVQPLVALAWREVPLARLDKLQRWISHAETAANSARFDEALGNVDSMTAIATDAHYAGSKVAKHVAMTFSAVARLASTPMDHDDSAVVGDLAIQNSLEAVRFFPIEVTSARRVAAKQSATPSTTRGAESQGWFYRSLLITAIWHDYDILSDAALRRKLGEPDPLELIGVEHTPKVIPNDGVPVDPSYQGPCGRLWPNGEPNWTASGAAGSDASAILRDLRSSALTDKLERAISSLSKDDQTVFQLLRRGMTPSAIARFLDRSPKTVERRIAQIRAFLNKRTLGFETPNNEQDIPKLVLELLPGDCTPVMIADYLSALSDLFHACGGVSLKFKRSGTKIYAMEEVPS